MAKAKVGHICVISSSQTFVPLPGMVAWSASKAAVHDFACTIRAEMQRYNVKVYVYNPGPIETAGYYRGRMHKD